MPIAPIVSALPHRLFISLVLFLCMDVQALTLGRVQGAALIGRPLAVTVQVQLDPNQSITSACFEADVFHGDTRQNPAGVQLRLEPAGAGSATANLRITSSSRVDEPVVTVYLRAGCAQMSSRRYVLLADIVSEQADPAPRVAAVPLVDGARMAPSEAPRDAATSAPAPASALAAPLPSAPARPGPAAASPRPPRAAASRGDMPVQSGRTGRAADAARATPRAVAKAPPAPRSNAAAPTVDAPAAARGTGQSRLRLDPLEMLSDRVATLESQAQTAAPTSERDALEVQRLERLEASVKALLVLAEKNEASLLDLRARLEQAQAGRFSNTVIYALFGMLLLSLLAIAYLLARINRGQESGGARWFDAAAGSAAPDSVPPAAPAARPGPAALQPAGTGTVPKPAADSAPAALAAGATHQATDRLPIEPTRPMQHGGMAPPPVADNAQVDVSLVEMSASTFDRLMQSGSVHSAVRRAQETVPMAPGKGAQAMGTVAARARIHADELVDIRQRAEFFVTLGQTDQAVQVLETRIAQDGASCPQVYLDLFQLFHSLGLKADFDQLRDDFTRLFNGRVPEFADFDDEGRVLEDYPGAIDRLIRVWSRPNVLEVLEQMLYTSPGADVDDNAFDLAAFRDLLVLHAVAQTVRAGAAGSSGAMRAPMPAAGGAENAVDIDLSELFASDAAPTMVLPRASADASPGVDMQVDLPLDNAAPVPAAAQDAPPGNLIDFDLDAIDFARKPGKDS